MTATAARRPGAERDVPVSGARKAVPAGEVARLYGLGLSMGEITGIYGVSEWVIGSRLDGAGVRRRAPGGRRSLPLDRAVRGYRRRPDRLAELAAGLGIALQIIVDRAAKPAPAERGQGICRADVRAADVADLYRAGWTVKQIAGRYRTAANTILNRLESAGVARRPKGLPAGCARRRRASPGWPASTGSATARSATTWPPGAWRQRCTRPACCAESRLRTSPCCTRPG